MEWMEWMGVDEVDGVEELKTGRMECWKIGRLGA